MSTNINRGYSINFVTNTITLTKSFERKANTIGSEEYTILKTLREEFPQLKAMHKTPQTKRKNTQITYAAMEKYIRCLPNTARYLSEFETVKQMASIQDSAYNFVKKWFVATFPCYNELPTFDANGQLVTMIQEKEDARVIAELREVA